MALDGEAFVTKLFSDIDHGHQIEFKVTRYELKRRLDWTGRSLRSCTGKATFEYPKAADPDEHDLNVVPVLQETLEVHRPWIIDKYPTGAPSNSRKKGKRNSWSFKFRGQLISDCWRTEDDRFDLVWEWHDVSNVGSAGETGKDQWCEKMRVQSFTSPESFTIRRDVIFNGCAYRFEDICHRYGVREPDGKGSFKKVLDPKYEKP